MSSSSRVPASRSRVIYAKDGEDAPARLKAIIDLTSTGQPQLVLREPEDEER